MRMFSIYFISLSVIQPINFLEVTSLKIYRNYVMNDMESKIFNSLLYQFC